MFVRNVSIISEDYIFQRKKLLKKNTILQQDSPVIVPTRCTIQRSKTYKLNEVRIN
jgi:hypothetical protein